MGYGDTIAAVIIAGGKGTRLGLVGIPKSMVEIGGKPLLEHQIELAKNYGIKDVYILSNHLADVILAYFGDGKRFGINITHIVEDYPLGTAGAVKQLERRIKERFLVFYGDVVLDMDISAFIEYDTLVQSIATITVHPNDHPCDSDLVEINDKNIVTAFHPKPHDENVYYSNLVNAAVYILSSDIFKYIPKDRPTDFGMDIFPLLLRSGKTIRAYKTAEYIKDIGTTERLTKVKQDFLYGKIGRYSKKNKRPAIFLDKDGTLIKYVNLLHKAENLEIYPYAASSIKKINESDYLCFLVTNQPVVARNLCDISEVKEMDKRLETLLGKEGAYLNDIYFCPHHPDKGYPEENPYFKIDCNCRKPKTGMVDRIAREYNVDIDSSWFIGDTTIDIQTGINAGMKTVLLRTGLGGKDRKFDCKADYVFNNFAEAVDFILENRYRHERYIRQIIEDIQQKKRLPYIISVAGLARSGKSTFIKLLSQYLYEKGICSQVVSLDNWLVGVDERTDTMMVRDRYRYAEIERDIAKLLNGEEISIKVYDPYSRNIVGEKPVSINGSGLIIDGIPALDIDYLRNISDVKVYIEIDEIKRMERFFSYYRWKELNEEEIERLYRARLDDEVSYIIGTKKYADIIIEVRE